ncbi:hypothetical protein NLJ89_g11716 [Agrocybe chaxingu]|uniref:PhoD-like phosphatase domain-containing protein n=1 Tax=Agrocybe chaxingu TaxID=84603 RepID=A0A9W8JNP0_9AGAR|nr:hypothetical protein NLJ89_g11716 [Agrocybe chaxingu]
MDNAGWHAHRRAQKENEAYLREYRNSAAAGHALAHDDVGPMEESFIGGYRHHPPPSPLPPALPPKDFPYTHPPHPQPSQTTISTSRLTHMTAVERSQTLRVARMDPHLQFMCGPLLKYDTIDEHGIWHGAALIVSQYHLSLLLSVNVGNRPTADQKPSAADSGSIYEPHPTLTYTWDPDQSVPDHTRNPSQPNSALNPTSPFSQRSASSSIQSPSSPPRSSGLHGLHSATSYELGPHPADPHSTVLPASPTVSAFSVPSYPFSPGQHQEGSNGHGNGSFGADGGYGPNTCSEKVLGQELWVYGGHGGTFTFWRFLIKVPLSDHEMAIKYSINNGQQLEFWVPGRMQNMRWAAYSCNGFSAGVNPDDFRGPGFKSGYDPVWMDLLSKHSETPFHALVGGGDQLYCDSLMREPEMQDWVSKMKPEEKKSYPLSTEMELAIDRFFFNHYCQAFRTGAFARANCSIPMLNMCDDHDLVRRLLCV